MIRTKITAALAGAIALLGMASTAHANPSVFANATSTAAATTTLSYMTPGTATTTTPVYDAYAQTFAGGSIAKADYAGLLVQLTSSSSVTVLNATAEYSHDGIDWYRNFVVDPNTIGTTTAPVFSVTNPFSFRWQFATSTVGGTGLGTSNRATAALLIPTPFRFTRVVFSLTGGNGAVWAQLVPIKEVR
jgi:hypothetical protein